jgi:alkanesulfonate monooxygenase SsuD/methylene tetrahydromethanopterin reductase-like flavin-dependent oxidoreductase (luciferase family)
LHVRTNHPCHWDRVDASLDDRLDLGIRPVFAPIHRTLTPSEECPVTAWGSAAAADRKARLDDLAGYEYKSDALIFNGTPVELADSLLKFQSAGLTGFRLRPGAIPHDLRAITRALVPEFQHREAFRNAYEAGRL